MLFRRLRTYLRTQLKVRERLWEAVLACTTYAARE